MDWELKTSTSDFNESGREDNARLAEVVRSSSSGVSKNAGGFSVDLKLGGLGDLAEGSAEKLEESRGCTIVSSSSGSSRRTRATNGTQNVLCLVDGCTADLSKCRDYHRRHRVCERHSKTPVVLVGGKELRFCQQCSRFQSLEEFDEEKRSCRKRLDGHNRRRRKPHPVPFMSSGSSFLSNHQGGRLVQFGGPQSSTTTPAAAGIVPTWPTVGKQHRQLHVTDHRQSTAPSSLPSVYNGGDQRFPFLLGNDPAERSNQRVPEVSICHGLVDDHCYVPADSCMGPQKKSSSAGLAQSINSKRALCLLSTHSAAQSSSSGMGMDGHVVQFSRSQGTERRPPIPQDNDNLCNEIFEEVAADDLLEKGISHALPFSSWK